MKYKFNPLLAKLIQEVPPKSNFSATSSPGVTDDSSKGYSPGSEWINLSANKAYVCLDDTVGAAVWIETTGGGETNTASNIGTAGIGVFKQKAGVDLEFKKINAGSDKVTITDDVANGEVDIDIVTGVTGNSVCIGNDARLSNSRTPTAHKNSHESGGTDEISVAGLSGLLSGDQHVLDAEVQAVSINNVAEDTSPQLGGTLDTNSKQVRWSKGADVVSALALPVLADGNYFDVTGANAITSIDTMAIGTMICLHFDAALTLTHNVTDLILPSAANITTAAGDEAIFIEYNTGDWRCVVYTKANGEAVVGGGAVITSGSYTGNSTSNHARAHSIGATPKFISLVRTTNGGVYQIVQPGQINFANDSVTTSYAVTAADATNFYVGNAANYGVSANLDTIVYYWVAIG